MTKILKKIFTSFVILSFLNSITFAQSISNNALPTNPTISSGSANISQTTNKLTVNQNTDKLITNWSSFNIGKDATVQFVQPSSTSSALNRVTSSDPSYIFGTLQANGKIILLNPNGVLFANGAKVDVGSIIASTLKTADKDFLSDQLIFEKDNLAGTIQNDGTIRAFAGGTVALIGSQVTNNGKIKTKQGTTALLAGDKVTLTLNGNRLIKYNIDEGTLNSLVENNNAIIAKEGVVILSAKALNLLSKSSVNNTGNIEAKGFSQVGGKIYLDGDQTTNSGKLVASSKNNSGGLVQVTGEEVKLTSTASLDASGATGGGTILVGGSFQNSDPTVRQSRKTIIEGGSILNASAKKDGDGGTIVAWSDINNLNSVTSAQGTFLATGGLNSGNGGNIETSGHYLSTDSISVNASGLNKSGTWLLDPYNVTIGSSNVGTAYSSNFTPSATSTIKASDIKTSLDLGTSVTITTGSSGSNSGDITISNSNPISKTSGGNATLTLQAARNITIGTSSAITSTSGTLGITLSSANSGTGGVQINSDLTSNGGNILIGGPLDNTLSASFNGIDYAKNYVGGSNATASGIYVNAVTISSGAGNIVLNGQNLTSNITSGQPRADNPSGIYIAPNATITSTTGNILSKSKTAGENNFALSIDSTASSLTTINSSGGGYIKLDTISYNSADTNPAAAIGLTTPGLKDKIKFSSLPTVAGLLILVNGSTQPILFTAASNSACTGTITNCGDLEGPGSNSSFKFAIYGSSTSATLATYVNVGSGTKFYDGSTTATGFTSASFSKDTAITWPTGFDEIYINSHYVFKTSSKNVGTYSSLTDYMLNGVTTPATFTDSSNNKVYAIGWTYTNPYTITAKSLTTTLTGTASKVYDGSISSTLSTSNFSVLPEVGSESISVTQTVGTYDNKNVGTSKSVTANLSSDNYSAGLGTLLSNYTLTTGNITSAIGTITQKALTASGLSGVNKTYDGTTTASLTGSAALQATESAGAGTTSDGKPYSVDSVSISGTATGTFTDRNVADARTVNISGLSLTGTGYGNYTLTAPTTSANITAKALTASGLSGVNKTYDGTTTASLTGSAALQATESAGAGTTSDGKPYSVDSVSISGTATGTFTDRNVADARTINISGLSLTGTGYGNYTLTAPTTSANITAKALTASGLSGVNKTYDGTTTASLTGSAALQATESAGAGTTSDGKPYSVDSVSISGTATGTFTDRNVADARTVNISGLSLTGTGYGNYTLTAPTTSANITAKALTASGLSGVNKTYDGTTTASLTGSAALQATESAGAGTTSDGKPYSVDSVSISGTATGTFTDRNVADARTVNISGLSLTGTGYGNYTLTAPTTSANITAKALTASGLSGVNKTYDGTTTASLTGSAALQATESAGAGTTSDGKPYSVDSVSISGTATGTFTDRNVADARTVNISGLSLTGTGYGNYTLTAPTTSANITAKALTASISSASSTYGSTTTPGTLTLTGIVESDSVSGSAVSIVSPSYSTSNNLKAGTYNQSVTSTLSGTDAGNYTLTGGYATTNNNYTVNAKPLSVSGLSADNKVYDGTTDATITGTASFSGTVGTDVLSVNSSSVTGTFADKNVGNSKAINLSGVTLTGTDSNNYTVSGVAGVSANITAKSLTTTLTGTASKEYDANTTATLSGSNYSVATGVSGETISVTKTTGTYNNKNVGTSKTVTATLASGDYSISGTGALLSNYTLTTGDITGGIGTITAKTVGLSASKTYDGSTSLTDYVTLTTGITGEALTYTGATSNNSHVATASKYISAITLADGTGGLASNYQLPTLNNSNAPVTITAKALTASAAATNKTYDGTTAATTTLTLSGLIGTETLGQTVASTFSDKNAGTGKTVTVNSIDLADGSNGGLASNYSISAGQTTTANINAKALTASAAATNKTYDGTTAATTTLTLSGLIGTETLGQTVASTFSDKNAGTGKTVTVNSIDLADGSNGGLASNYSISAGQTTTANINAKSLTISGITASDKDYDGTTTATVSTSGVVYSGKVSGDSVTVSATGTFQSASAGRGKTVNLTSTYSGTDVSNYNITGQSTTTANINSVGDSDNSNSSNSNSSNSNSNSSKVRCELTDCNKDKLSNGEIVIVRKNTFTSDNVKVTPVSIKPEVETRKDQAAPSLIKIIVLKPGQEPKVDKEYEVSIRGNDAILKEQTDIIDKTITNPGKSIGSARFSIENDKGKILEYNMVVRESGLEIRPLSFDALLFADKNKATVAGAAMIDVANNLKLPVDGIKTILFDLIIDKVFEDAMFNQKDSNRNIFNINYY